MAQDTILPRRKVRLVVFQGRDGQWYWHAKARNGEIIADGEAYTRKWTARRGAQRAFPDGTLVEPVVH